MKLRLALAALAAVCLLQWHADAAFAQGAGKGGFGKGAGKGGPGKGADKGGSRNAAELPQLLQQGQQQYSNAEYAEAEQTARKALALAEEIGASRPIALATGLLGSALFQLGHAPEAEALLRKATLLREAEFGPNHRNTLSIMGLLGVSLSQQGKYAEAQSVVAEALRREEGVSQRGAPELTRAYMQYGSVLTMTRRFEAAEEQLSKAIENGSGSKDSKNERLVAQSTYLYAKVLWQSGRGERALDYSRRSVALWEGLYTGQEHAPLAHSLVLLGQVLVGRGATAEAETVMARAVPMCEKLLGPDHRDTASANMVLGLLAERNGHYAEAEAAMKRGLESLRKGDSPAQLIGSASNYGKFLERRGRDAEAIEQLKLALDTIDRLYAGTRGLDEEAREAFASRYAPLYYETVRLLMKMHRANVRAGYDRQALAVVSRTQSRLFAEMLRQSDVRTFAGDPAFQKLEQERTSLTERLAKARGAKASKARVDALGVAAEADGETVVATRADRAAAEASRAVADLEASLKAVEQRLARDYPRFMELVQPRPVEVADLQKLLRPGEALLSFFMLPHETIVFLVTPGQFAARPAGMDRKELAALVWKARHFSESTGGSVASLAELDPAVLNRLYQVLVQPVESMLKPGQKIIIVGDGPLYTLPLEMLVSGYGPAERQRFEAQRAAARGSLTEYGTLSYLGDRYRFSYLPSLSALGSQRLYAKPRPAFERELVSFADPVFAKESGQTTYSEATRAILSSVGAAAPRGPGTSLLPRLPDTADEANGIARVLGGKSSLYLRENAQERTAKTLDLRATRFVHFATHGLLGGEFLQVKQSLEEGDDAAQAAGTQRNLMVAAAAVDDDAPAAAPGNGGKPRKGGQPALALTLVGDMQGEDGLLMMSEVIENLNLNADVVVLSACNTAGETAEASNGEGFAGLTRAFMYAGARSLIVSHWSVDSVSTTLLVTSAFGNMKAGQPLDEALAKARSAVRLSSGQGYSRSHPYFWAPFVQIGD